MPVLVNTTKNNTSDVDRSKKNSLSIILEKSGREWIDITKEVPDPGVPVVIRFTNESIIFAEDDENVIYSEDEKVARLAKTLNGEKPTKWIIEPPYLKYDYSPLSSKDQLIDGSCVTHWAPITDDELKIWRDRLNPVGDYKHLSLHVSSEYEELVYRALLNGANMIARSVSGQLDAEGNELEMAMYAALTDLQMCIDRNVHISNGRMINNATSGVSEFEDGFAIYQDMIKLCDGDTTRVSKLINALRIIDDNPEKYAMMAEDGNFEEYDEEDDESDEEYDDGDE